MSSVFVVEKNVRTSTWIMLVCLIAIAFIVRPAFTSLIALVFIAGGLWYLRYIAFEEGKKHAIEMLNEHAQETFNE